jgi:hypothetical protein
VSDRSVYFWSAESGLIAFPPCIYHRGFNRERINVSTALDCHPDRYVDGVVSANPTLHFSEPPPVAPIPGSQGVLWTTTPTGTPDDLIPVVCKQPPSYGRGWSIGFASCGAFVFGSDPPEGYPPKPLTPPEQ